MWEGGVWERGWGPKNRRGWGVMWGSLMCGGWGGWIEVVVMVLRGEEE